MGHWQSRWMLTVVLVTVGTESSLSSVRTDLPRSKSTGGGTEEGAFAQALPPSLPPSQVTLNYCSLFSNITKP